MKKKGTILKVFCTFLLSILLILTGVFIVNKYVFSHGENKENEVVPETSVNEQEKYTLSTLPVQETVVNYQENIINDYEPINTGVEVVLPEQKDGIIIPAVQDLRVIPDKYNTGCKGELIKVTGSSNIGGLETKESNGTLVFDFFYRNKDVSGTYTIENCDFSDFEVKFNSEAKVSGKKINIVFNNCCFGLISTTMRPPSEVFTYVYNNCTIKKFGGSNSEFNKCKFGDSYSDCIVPFNNVSVNDCYFSNLASNDPKGNGKHSDGTQIYGYSDAKVKNVNFTNCRFEIPAVKTTKSTAAVNACIMLSLEYNDAENIKIENCIVNGGGYTIYAGKKNPELKMSDIVFSNIKIGEAKLFGNIYPSIDENVTFTNVVDQDSLYVSSVWNDGEKTHIIVSNDTGRERILKVVTENGSIEHTIGACLGGNELRYDNFDKPFEEFPFDVDIAIDSSPDYIICFDVTDGYEKQIRYVSFDGKPTYYEVNSKPEISLYEEAEAGSDTYVIEGKCGKNIIYKLNSNGVLKLEGTGAMENYHSTKRAPWYDYSDSVVSVEISDGITIIGTQAFRNLKNIQSIELPESVTKIESNAFSGCNGLTSLSMHSGITKIGKYAFNGTHLIRCSYYGSEDEWDKIEIDAYNNALQTCNKEYMGIM